MIRLHRGLSSGLSTGLCCWAHYRLSRGLHTRSHVDSVYSKDDDRDLVMAVVIVVSESL